MWPWVQSLSVVLVTFILQAAVAPHMAIMGAEPDIILIVTALYGFTFGPTIGALVGFSGGLLGDLLAGPHVGLGLISKSIVGFFAGMVQKTIFVENILLPMLAIFVATWLNEFVYVGFLFLFGDVFPIKQVVLQVVLPSAIYNAVLTPFVYVATRRLMQFKQQETPMVNITKKYE